MRAGWLERDDKITQRMGERAEGGANFDAVAERGRLPGSLLGCRQLVLSVRQAVQHRGVLREQQRDDDEY